jgi:hypothetical protein
VYLTQITRAYIHAPYTFVANAKPSDALLPPQGTAVSIECIAHEATEHNCPETEDRPQGDPEWQDPELLPEPVTWGNLKTDTPYDSPRTVCELGSEVGAPITLVMKALIPLSKIKGLMDEDDIPENKDNKCDACANCPTCRLSARTKTRSL